MRPNKTEQRLKPLIRFGILLTILAQVSFAKAADVSIFEMRKSLPMNPGETAVHDYYINAGTEAGLKKDMYLTVVRAMSVQDPGANRAQGTLHITIAHVQVVQAEKNISVARLYSEFTDDERPAVDYEAIMLGDRIDMDSVTMEEPKIKHHRKAASIEIEKPQSINVQAQAVAVLEAPAAAVANVTAPPFAQPVAEPATPIANPKTPAVAQTKAVLPAANGQGVAAQNIIEKPKAPNIGAKASQVQSKLSAKADNPADDQEESTAADESAASVTGLDPNISPAPQVERNAPSIQVAPAQLPLKSKVEKKTTAGLEALGSVPDAAASQE